MSLDITPYHLFQGLIHYSGHVSSDIIGILWHAYQYSSMPAGNPSMLIFSSPSSPSSLPAIRYACIDNTVLPFEDVFITWVCLSVNNSLLNDFLWTINTLPQTDANTKTQDPDFVEKSFIKLYVASNRELILLCMYLFCILCACGSWCLISEDQLLTAMLGDCVR